jgi:hypothetical protein
MRGEGLKVCMGEQKTKEKKRLEELGMSDLSLQMLKNDLSEQSLTNPSTSPVLYFFSS